MSECVTEPDPRFAATAFVVEADSFARHMLWRDHAAEAAGLPGVPDGPPRFPWQQDNSGLLIQIGSIEGKPVCIDCMWATIAGKLVLFYSGCSRVVDHTMIEEWLKERCNPRWDRDTRRAHCDAMNFHHCLHALAE